MIALVQNLTVQEIHFSEACYIAKKFPKSPPNSKQKYIISRELYTRRERKKCHFWFCADGL